MTTNRDQKPLMLKDFLALDPNSNSCRHSWAHNASVRYLLEAELCGGSLVRSRPKSAFLSRISAVIKNLHLSSPTRTNRTFLSKLVSGSFWKKRVKVVRVKDIVRMNSFDVCGERRALYLPSVLSSSSSSSSSSCSERHRSPVSAEFVLSANSSSDCSVTREDPIDQALQSPKRNMASHGENKQEECRGCREEEKDQLSPVSVMDFPYQDDTENEEATSSSPCFEQSLANIEKTKHELLQKIRRFESLAELDPIDLSASFTSAENHVELEEEDMNLIQRLRFDGYRVGPNKRLFFDFFVEGMTLDTDIERLVAAAEDWMRGCGHLDADEHGKVQIEEMERNRRWRCFQEEKEEVAADVEVEVLDLIVDELVLDVLLLGLPQSSK